VNRCAVEQRALLTAKFALANFQYEKQIHSCYFAKFWDNWHLFCVFIL